MLYNCEVKRDSTRDINFLATRRENEHYFILAQEIGYSFVFMFFFSFIFKDIFFNTVLAWLT